MLLIDCRFSELPSVLSTFKSDRQVIRNYLLQVFVFDQEPSSGWVHRHLRIGFGLADFFCEKPVSAGIRK